MGKIKFRFTLACFTCLASMGSYGSPVDLVTDQANALANGNAGTQGVVMDAGQRPFQLTPNNGYVGLKTRLDIASLYTSYEYGGQNVRQVVKAVVDWGDGSSPSTAKPGEPIYHTYGHRSDRGSITPDGSIVYTGRISFVTYSGDVFTEQFKYSMWNDYLNSLVPGGRVLPNSLLPNVNGADGRAKLPSGFFDRNSQ
ncbi:hypothetical protein [Modicisalibacter xianhensis]|uniref:Uncharacterized protein n=1 Tax=Modicisalibacter xianhensis TaxID=442341 RepID=A0A1I3ELJ5_9GAMM|nr:hypothetical protein [Halomonas xianhensis]SFH99849.1 hypothetical protein SAMN04487959_11439 [Halomonas xianhensis]